MTQNHPRPPRRNAVMPDRARLELRVDPTHPVIRCSRCGDPLPFGRIGRCDDCTGRSGSAVGCLAISILVAILAIAVLAGSSIVAPRSAQTTLLVDVSGQRSAEPTGAPRDGERLDPGDGNQNGSSPEGSSLRRLTTAGAPPPPAVANVATSEGLSSPTTPTPAPRFRGLATWFCLSGRSACTSGYGQDDLVAAIDTDLGFGKGDRIRVRYGDRSVVVRVVDVCGCPGDRLVDLTSGAFARLADLDVGVIPVTVELAGPGATLPATETTP